jgi:hypothetical protein
MTMLGTFTKKTGIRWLRLGEIVSRTHGA